MNYLTTCLTSSCICLTTACCANAAMIDQSNVSENDQFIAYSAPPGFGAGQSFTPSLDSIQQASFRMYKSVPGEASARVDLHQGDGFGGALLGSTPVLDILNTSPQDVVFTFGNAIELNAGQVYTLRVFILSGGTLLEAEADGNYVGGQAYAFNGTAISDNDMVFAEGPWLVPEPTSLAMLGFGALVLCARRR